MTTKRRRVNDHRPQAISKDESLRCSLARGAVRVIQYRGNGRTETLKEREHAKGYAHGFEELINYIHGLLPANEVIGQSLRKNVSMFPELAVRELVANALLHQDFFVSGAGEIA